MNFKLNCCSYISLYVYYIHNFYDIFETLQHGILAKEGASPLGTKSALFLERLKGLGKW